jgi:hypothetical protein
MVEFMMLLAYCTGGKTCYSRLSLQTGEEDCTELREEERSW